MTKYNFKVRYGHLLAFVLMAAAVSWVIAYAVVVALVAFFMAALKFVNWIF